LTKRRGEVDDEVRGAAVGATEALRGEFAVDRVADAVDDERVLDDGVRGLRTRRPRVDVELPEVDLRVVVGRDVVRRAGREREGGDQEGCALHLLDETMMCVAMFRRPTS
jgi:hypothetical protein